MLHAHRIRLLNRFNVLDMKINGNKIRAYQGGELIGEDFSVYFSESLQFVAVEAFYNDTNSNKMVEVKMDDDVLYSDTFKECKIIHSAKLNECATSLFIFHNSSNIAVSDFRDVFEFIRLQQQKESDHMIREQIRRNTEALNDISGLNKIPMWIRRIFKAV